MTRLRSIATILCAAALTACGEEAVQDIAAPLSGASIRFFNYGVNAPAVNFFADEVKVTAALSTSCPLTSTDPLCTTTGLEATTGVAYASVGSGGLYSVVAPGQHVFSGKIAATTDKNLAIASLTSTVADGKFYSYYMSGFYNATTKTSDAFIVEDPFIANIDYAVAYVRFVNAISNSSPMTLSVKSTVVTTSELTVGGPVAYKSAGDFTAVPGGPYELFARTTGSTANAISRTGTNFVTFAPGRVYTISARGDMTVTSTTAVNRPFLDNTANR